MKNLSFDEFRKLPDGTLFTADSPDAYVSRAVLAKGADNAHTGSSGVVVYERDDLKKLQAKVEAALGLCGHKAGAK